MQYRLEQASSDGTKWYLIDAFDNKPEADDAARKLARYSGKRTRVTTPNVVSEFKP